MNLGWLTLKERQDYLTLGNCKSLNSLAPNYQSDVSDVHERTTRQSQNSDLYLCNVRTSYMKNHCNIMVLTCGINYLLTFVILITFKSLKYNIKIGSNLFDQVNE